MPNNPANSNNKLNLINPGVIQILFILLIFPTIALSTGIQLFLGLFQTADLKELFTWYVWIWIGISHTALILIVYINTGKINRALTVINDSGGIHSLEKNSSLIEDAQRAIAFLPKLSLFYGLVSVIITEVLILIEKPFIDSIEIILGLIMASALSLFLSIVGFLLIINNIESRTGLLPFSRKNKTIGLNAKLFLSITMVVGCFSFGGMAVSFIQINSGVNIVQALTKTSVVLAVFFLFTFLVVKLLQISITKPLITALPVINNLTKGDMTDEFDIKTKDEVGKIFTRLNEFVINLKSLLTSFKSSSINSLRIGEELGANTEETTAAAVEITSNVTSIKQQITELETRITSALSEAEGIAANVEKLTDITQTQSSAVDQSSASIEEMIASINNITSITMEKKNATDNLVMVTGMGSEKISNTNKIINDIAGKANDMLDMITVINNISSQTDLLSMNAAIEAAHAGDAGKGFAVVADEIRKLSDSTHANSKNISESLKETIESIQVALTASNESGEAFDRINSEVMDVSDGLTEISNSMTELSTGSSEVLKAVTILVNVSEEVKTGTEDINQSTGKIGKVMQDIDNLSTLVSNGTKEIETGVQEISIAMTNIAELSRENTDAISELKGEVDKFKTE